MEKHFDILRKCKLFDGIENENLAAMLSCLNAKSKLFKKGQIVFSEGEKTEHFGIVLSGAVQIVREDFYGNRSIVTAVTPSQIFGEAFACAGVEVLPVSVVAAENTEVLLINSQRVTAPCTNACSFHSRLIYNLLKIVANKNLIFHKRIEITSKRTTREKLMTYLLMQAKENKSDSFTIPYDRQQLADYLEVDRSGLSSEIGKLRNEGVIKCVKSHFTLLKVSARY